MNIQAKLESLLQKGGVSDEQIKSVAQRALRLMTESETACVSGAGVTDPITK